MCKSMDAKRVAMVGKLKLTQHGSAGYFWAVGTIFAQVLDAHSIINFHSRGLIDRKREQVRKVTAPRCVNIFARRLQNLSG